ncbi:hypothetical protein ABOM_008567 [Aspergillus bombycis]|uniref:Uncharacterized protein n=1 Tax=Aspergillus bombycis TaxID=109264 RepID=A0A1F7ZW20_9EURO|nr:hypothetical protein ABOM_008567 [Aspergillus bombycis]OGM43634.1 hypothetical protein ABOM_008567 [Aspergillus bombycis]
MAPSSEAAINQLRTVFPKLTEALAIVKQTGSKFAIHTTGHNLNAGFSSAEETTISLDLGREIPGGDVYAWLEEQKLSAIGGRDQQEGSDDDDAAAQQAVDTMSETVHSLAKEKGLLLNFKCMGFATASQRVLGSYGAENIRRMQEAAAKYDPEGFFQKLQYGWLSPAQQPLNVLAPSHE